tara:strand:+ start:1312 stop:1716 length:405 start_codon:yes stop_codon:yes gene_type:complete
MVLLHLRLTEYDSKLTLPHDIKAQELILRKISISKDSGDQTLGGGVMLDFHQFSNSYELMTSEDNGMLCVPLGETASHITQDYHIKFGSEDIKREFHIKTFKYDGTTKALFTSGTGHINSIDIFFEYSTNEHIV